MECTFLLCPTVVHSHHSLIHSPLHGDCPYNCTRIEMLCANSTVVRPRVEHALTTQALGVEHNLTGTLTQNEEPHDSAQQTMMTKATTTTTCTGKSLCVLKSSKAVIIHSAEIIAEI